MRCYGGGTRFFGEYRAIDGDGGARVTDVRDHRHAPFDLFDGERQQRALLRVGEAHVLAFRHRQRQRLCAVFQMEIKNFCVGIVVDALIGLERGDGGVDESGLEGGHEVCS